MSGTDVDLVHLIDLSLGSEPCGVVNFNYLHGLLHEIVKRLQPSSSYLQGGEQKASEESDGASTETSGAPIRPVASGYIRSKSSMVSAANDMSALERKLHELETRFNTMESLPELLERKSSDSGATPVSDMWNFTNISKRLNGTEEGLEKTSRLVDDLLGELQSLKAHVSTLDTSVSEQGDRLSGEIDSMKSKVKDLEGLRLSAAQDSMGNAAAAMLGELSTKMEKLQSDSDQLKQQVSDIDLSQYVTNSSLDSTLSKSLEKYDQTLRKHESSLKSQGDSLSAIEKSLEESSEEIGQLTARVEEVEEELSNVMEMIKKMETAISGKVNAEDLMSLMPSGGSDEAVSLLPKLIELQTKLSQLEAQMGAVPSDVVDQISSMQRAIDRLTDQIAILSSQIGAAGGEDKGRVDELGSEIAQLRERMGEVDRAVSALSQALSSSRQGPQAEVEPDGAKYVDTNSFEALQGLLSQLQQEHERLMGTTAHLSHELEVNKDHVKSLYGGVDELRESKADKSLLELEVREKADRKALEGKANREWVDSTFERLDKEIREARSKLLGQEEAFKSAMSQLNEDVEGKLDRMELQPLKDYFDKKLERNKPAPTIQPTQEALADDAAGFKKPLRFRCISCDKPVGIKPLTAIPALPSVATFPSTRSFRPYTTYELELIRRHQRMGYPLATSLMSDLSRSVRSAGGTHTMTRAHQRIRVAPMGTPYTPEPASYMSTRSSPMIHDELEIVGQDGHIYKGRHQKGKLPPLTKNKTGRYSRPATSPLQKTVTL